MEIERKEKVSLLWQNKFALTLIMSLSAVMFADNPVIKHRFSADPSPHVFNGTIYLYATNDQGNSGKYWDSTDWRLFSSNDLATWKDYGSFLSVKVFKWCASDAKAWAPCAATRNGKYYFDKFSGRAIRVLKS